VVFSRDAPLAKIEAQEHPAFVWICLQSLWAWYSQHGQPLDHEWESHYLPPAIAVIVIFRLPDDCVIVRSFPFHAISRIEDENL
jgi:hypothetical protein